MRSPVAASLSIPYSGVKDSRVEPIQGATSAMTTKPPPTSNAEQRVRVKQEVDERILPPTRVDTQPLNRTQSDRSLADEPPLGTRGPGYSPSKPAYDGKDDQRLSRDNSWTYRNGADDKAKYDTDRNGRFNGDSRITVRPDNRGPDISPRFHDRERDRDWEHDRDRRSDFSRFRDDRRNDDRLRGSDNRRPPEPRLFEPRVADTYRPLERRPDDGGPLRSLDDRLHPDSRPPFRNLGEERAIVRGPADPPNPNHPLPGDHRQPTTVAPTVDDRRPPLSTPSDRTPRDFEDRRPPPPPAPADRPLRGPEDRRLSPPPANDRLLRSPADRRPPPGAYQDRQARPIDDRRPPPLSGLSGPERQVRPQDESRGPPLPPSSAERPPPSDDRRPYVPPSTFDRNRGNDDRRVPPALEDRNTRPGATLLRTLPDERSLRSQLSKEDLSARPPVSLEERLSRHMPSLSERITANPTRPDDKPTREPPARLDERSARPTPSLEERLSRPIVDDRISRPPVEERVTRPMPPPPAIDRTARPDDRSSLLAESIRPVLSGPPDRAPRSDDRGRPIDNFRARSPPDRGPAPRPSVYPPRAQSIARDPPRKFEPRSRTRSPARPDILRAAGDPPPPRDRNDMRPPYRPEPGRYNGDRRPDMMDVDPPAPRFGASYRRPSPPPPAADNSLDPYPRPRAWPPSNDPYPEDPAHRPAPDVRPYDREWRDGERNYPDDWDSRAGRDWERPPPREYERDRFDAPPAPGWETREERERRVSSTYPPPADAAPAPRSFETRPLGSRLSDGYHPPEDRSYPRDLERPRYPAPEPDPPFSRVRPRSPSPLRRPGAVDDLRPPVKRARDDSYGAAYYPPSATEPPLRAGPPADYPPRARSPPAVGSSTYFDDQRAPPYRSGPPPPLARDREYADPRDRAPDVGGYASFERREPPPRIHRSPPPYNRFGRDERRYSVPPR